MIDQELLDRLGLRARFTNSERNAMKSSLVCRFVVFPCTFPVFTSKAAYNDSVRIRRALNTSPAGKYATAANASIPGAALE